MLVERNARGQQIPAGLNRTIPAENGTNIVLTLDSSLTYALEGMTAQAVGSTGAKSGMTAIADIATGDIVALSNMRTNSAGQVFPAEDNSALVSVYEPGSVTKVITIAAALENGVVNPGTRLNVPDRMQVSDHNFKDDEPHKEAMLTPGEILTNSSNIGTIKIAQQLGRKQIDRYMRGFGLGMKTGINFPGESAGILPPLQQWTGTSIGTVPIGQGLAVTALQMLGVYTTIANKGVRVPLHLVHSTVDKNGVERKLKTSDPVRVISEQTAKQVSDMLESVVRSGTGKKAQVNGYRVAGKTGTAQKPNEFSRGYNPNAYVASFIGYFPADNPRFAILSMLDEPKTSIYGGATAAPLFAEIAHFLGQHYRIPPSSGSEVTTSKSSEISEVATVIGATREMRAVAQAGSWQQAEIRKAATLGVAGVVANSAANQTADAAQSVAPVEPAAVPTPSPAPALLAPQPGASPVANLAVPVLPSAAAPSGGSSSAPFLEAPVSVAPAGAPSLSPFAVTTLVPAPSEAASVVPAPVAVVPFAVVPLAVVPLASPVAEAGVSIVSVPTISASNVPTVDSVSPGLSVAGQAALVQPAQLPNAAAPVAKQPIATVPDLSAWRRSGKAVARAQILPTATAPPSTVAGAEAKVKVESKPNADPKRKPEPKSNRVASAVTKKTSVGP